MIDNLKKEYFKKKIVIGKIIKTLNVCLYQKQEYIEKNIQFVITRINSSNIFILFCFLNFENFQNVTTNLKLNYYGNVLLCAQAKKKTYRLKH